MESLILNKKKQKKSAKYSSITFNMHKPKGNKYLSVDLAEYKKELGEEDSDEDDERFHDKDALELVRRMEQKHGNKTTKSGRKMKFAEDDFIDKTLGYDLDDDFIDDSEAHDELVPSTLDTEKGGFYVNKGKLEFVKKDELSDEEDSEDEADKPKKKKKEESVASSSRPTAKPAARAPKRPDLKADEAKKTVETKAKKRAALSSSDSEGEPQERRLVGGPPTLKRSKQNPAAAPAAKKAEEKKKEEKAAEARRMAGAPPSLANNKSVPAARPSLAGKPPSAAAAAAAVATEPKKTEPAPIETMSSEGEGMVVDEPPKLQAALPAPTATPIEVDMADVPGPVQVKLVQFRQLATQHMKQGKKFVPPILIDESIQINELTGRLGMKKSLRNLVIEMMAEMVGYSKAGLLQRMNQATRPVASTSVSSAFSTSTVATAATSLATTTTQSQQQSKVAQSVQSTTIQTGPSTSTTTKQTVIGVKPAGPAVLPKKGAEEKIGKYGLWTHEQAAATLAMYPTLSFDDFTEHLRNNGQNVPEAERDSMEAARKAYLKKLAAQSTDILATLNSHPEIRAAMAKFKAATLARYPSLGEKAILCMDFKDDTAGAFNAFVEHALGELADSPIQMLAYLDDAMKKHFGENGRTDRLIRHFAAKLPKHQKPLLEQVKLLPEYIDIGRQFTQREKELQQLVQKGNSTSMRPVSGGASSSKPVLKQPPTQTTPISQQQQLQQLMAQQPDKAVNSILTPMQASQIQALVSSLQGQAANVSNSVIHALIATMQQQLLQEKAKKAKEDEERRLAIAKAKADEVEKRRKEKEEAKSKEEG